MLRPLLLAAIAVAAASQPPPAARPPIAVIDGLVRVPKWELPADVQALHARGMALHRGGESRRAVGVLQAVLARAPGYARGWHHTGVALSSLGRHAQAARYHRRALALEPDEAMFLWTYGHALHSMGGRRREALVQIEGALAVNPNISLAQMTAGGILRELQEQDGARLRFEAALETPAESVVGGFSDGDRAACHFNLAELFKYSGDVYKSLAHSRAYLGLRPDSVEGFVELVDSYQELGMWDDLDKVLPRFKQLTFEALARGEKSPVKPFFAIRNTFTPAEELEIVRSHGRAYADPRGRAGLPPLPHPPREPLAPGQRLRVAFVTADVSSLLMLKLVTGYFMFYDRAALEVALVVVRSPIETEVLEAMRAKVDLYLDVSQVDDLEAAAEINRAFRPQVLVDLTGWTMGYRPGVIASQAAPIQVSLIGYPGTSGAPFLQYLVADPVLAPAELRDSRYSEKLIVMPHTYFGNSYQMWKPATRLSRAEAGFPVDASFVFVNFNQVWKIDRAVFGTWCRIVQRVPGSVLMLMGYPHGARVHLAKHVRACNLTEDRIQIVGRTELHRHLGRLAAGDLFLDTPLFAAHTTAADALYQGLPILAMKGERMANRISASLLSAIGVGQLVVDNLYEYEETAVYLATHPQEYQKARRLIMQRRFKAPLFDIHGWMRAFEDGLGQAWARYARGEEPAHIEVQARR